MVVKEERVSFLEAADPVQVRLVPQSLRHSMLRITKIQVLVLILLVKNPKCQITFLEVASPSTISLTFDSSMEAMVQQL